MKQEIRNHPAQNRIEDRCVAPVIQEKPAVPSAQSKSSASKTSSSTYEACLQHAARDFSISQQQIQTLRTSMHKRSRRNLYVCVLLLICLAALVVLNLTWGNTKYTFWQALAAAFGSGSKNAVYTMQTLRLPRIAAGILAGLSFGTAGHTLQKLLGNPLASPDIIGVSAGSCVAAVFAMLILGWSGWRVSALAVVAGIATTMGIYYLAHGQGFNQSRLILIGIGMQAFLNALISWLLQLASEYNVQSAMRWICGSLNDVRPENVPYMFVTTGICMVLILLVQRHLDILTLGDSLATTLGARPDRSRLILILLSVCLVAFATAITGPIAAVAFLSGPIASRLCKTGRTPAMAAGLMGAVLVLAADWIGQHAFAVRFPVGIVTGILGAPYLLILLMQLQKKEGD